MQFMVPYIRDKKGWPKPPDVMYERKLPADSSVDEVIRNFFIRQPALWVDAPVRR